MTSSARIAKSMSVWDLVGLIMLVLCCAATVLFFVKKQKAYRDLAVAYDYRTKQSALALSIAQNWYDSTVSEHRFTSYWSPLSPNHRHLAERQPYIRIPSGAIVPIYLYSRLSGCAPSMATVMLVNTAIHLLLVMLIVIGVYIPLRDVSVSVSGAITATLVAGLGFACSGKVASLLSLDYFCTEAVVPWFLVSVLCDYLARRREGVNAKLFGGASVLAVFLGCLTDWFMFIVGGFLWIAAVLDWTWQKQRRWIALVGCPAAVMAALCILAWHVQRAGQWKLLAAKFVQRTGLDGKADQAGLSLVKAFFHRGLGIEESVLVLFSLGSVALLWWCIRKTTRPAHQPYLRFSRYLLLLTLPSLVHCLVLSEHYCKHGDNALKFLVAMHMIPFSLLPALFLIGLEISGSSIVLYRPGRSTPLAGPAGFMAGRVIMGWAVAGGLLYVMPQYAGWRGAFEPHVEKMKSDDVAIVRTAKPFSSSNVLFISTSLRATDSYEDLRLTGILRNHIYRLPEDAALIRRALQAPPVHVRSIELRKNGDFSNAIPASATLLETDKVRISEVDTNTLVQFMAQMEHE